MCKKKWQENTTLLEAKVQSSKNLTDSDLNSIRSDLVKCWQSNKEAQNDISTCSLAFQKSSAESSELQKKFDLQERTINSLNSNIVILKESLEQVKRENENINSDLKTLMKTEIRKETETLHSSISTLRNNLDYAKRENETTLSEIKSLIKSELKKAAPSVYSQVANSTFHHLNRKR